MRIGGAWAVVVLPVVGLAAAYPQNADRLGPLLTALEERGYEWIPLAEAIAHPAYDRPTHGYTGAGGAANAPR